MNTAGVAGVLRDPPVIHCEEERRKLAQALQSLAPMPETLPPIDLNDYSALWWTGGLITVAVWIGSDEHFFAPEKEGEALGKKANVYAPYDLQGRVEVGVVAG